ncbi:glycosyltransferase [Micromonospora zhanjiangensis]|uniref:Glycosyltransferase n=1 Tax=Micromonospora zhanjiangensis TaxID=1522057 RepID=A0ABV8KNS7_9ACTN
MPSPADTPAAARPSDVRVYRNDWSVLTPPSVGTWRPTRSVSVVIPAYNCQKTLDLTLASLAHQTYPAELLEVVVADDGSEPPIELPEIRPANCRIVRVPEVSDGWGRSNALHVGATHSDGEILHWLDADMVIFPGHVAEQVRWHHVSDEVVTLGYKRFVGEGWTTPEEVARRCAAGTIGELFRIEDTEPHDYVEKIIDDTDQLRHGDHLNFRAHVGATAALTRAMYERTGGLNTELRLGEDTEFGYRLTQAGAVFVPVPEARSWHMGATHMMTKGVPLRRFNHPYLADLMPQPRWLRRGSNRSWAVPLVTAVLPAEGSLERVRTAVDRLLASDLTDLRVKLVADWDKITDERRSILADPLLDRRLIQVTYRSDPRVELVGEAPETAYPSPFLLRLPAHVGVGPDTVRRLVAVADEWQVGLVRLLPAGAKSPDEAVSLWRTSAVSRAVRVRRPDEPLHKAVAAVAGERWLSGDDLGVDDLRQIPEAELSSPKPRLYSRPDKRRRIEATDGQTIPVGGVRSLAHATRFVARQAAAGAARKVRRRVRRQK